MARVEIEERAWSDPRLKDLANGLKTSTIFAMGVLAALWHDSQEQEKDTVDERQLRVWFSAMTRKKDVISALARSGYIEKMSDGCYRIDGNRHRIERVTEYKKRARKASNARWHSKETTVMLPGCPNSADATSMLEYKHQASVKQCPTYNMQHADIKHATKKEERCTSYSGEAALGSRARDALAHVMDRADAACEAPILEAQTVDANRDASQDARKAPRTTDEAAGMAKRRGPKKNASESTPGVHTLIAAFVTAWGQAYPSKDGALGKYPVAGKDAGAAKTIIKAVGLERALALVPAFIGMKTAFLIGRRHQLAHMANDLPAVVDFAGSGNLVTSRGAQRQEIAAGNDNLINRMIARDEEKARKAAGGADGQTIDVDAKAVANDPW